MIDTKIINIKGHDSMLTIYISNSSNIDTLSFESNTECNDISIYSIICMKPLINYIINRGRNIITNENNYDILYKGKQEKWRRYNTKNINEIMSNIDNIMDFNVSKVDNKIILTPNINFYNGVVLIHKNNINNIHPIGNSYYTIYNMSNTIINSIPIILNNEYQYVDSNGIIKSINNNIAKSFSDNINCIFQKPNFQKRELYNIKYNLKLQFIFNDINILSVCPIIYNV